MEKTVKVRLPKARNGEETEVFVGLNGRGYRIRKGMEVAVPEGVAEVLRNAEAAEDRNEVFLEENTYIDPL